LLVRQFRIGINRSCADGDFRSQACVAAPRRSSRSPSRSSDAILRPAYCYSVVASLGQVSRTLIRRYESALRLNVWRHRPAQAASSSRNKIEGLKRPSQNLAVAHRHLTRWHVVAIFQPRNDQSTAPHIAQRRRSSQQVPPLADSAIIVRFSMRRFFGRIPYVFTLRRYGQAALSASRATYARSLTVRPNTTREL